MALPRPGDRPHLSDSFQLSEREAAKLPQAERIEGSMLLREVDADDLPDTGPEVHRVIPELKQRP